ncbi:MAG: pimeloyl-ACP methyl ester esterase BioH [Burkholderiales bacterium]
MTIHFNASGTGPDLVLLHGWGMHGGIWDGVAAELAKDFRVYCVDLPGYGASPSLVPYALDSLVQRVSESFPEPVAVCGWSLGSMVAQRWAQTAPQQLKKLALVASTPRFVSGGDWPHGVEPDVLAGFAAGLEVDFEGSLKRFLSLQSRGDEHAKAVMKQLRERLFSRSAPDPGALRGGLDILLNADLRQAAARIAVPTLLIHGDYDRLTPLGAAQWLAKTLPAARLEVLRGCAHAPFLSHPAAFQRLLRDFLHD